MTFKEWLRQPSTINGIGAIAGGIIGTVAHFCGADPYAAAACGGATYALTQLGINDNSASVKPVEAFMQDAATAIMTKQLAARMPALIDEGVAAFRAIATPASTPALAPTPAPIPVTMIGAQLASNPGATP